MEHDELAVKSGFGTAGQTGRDQASAAPADRLAAAVAPPSPIVPAKVSWKDWCPGLDNDERTMRQVLATLPAAPAEAIPWIVRLFENPEGWLRLHGAVDLAHHDMIHVLLGRGLLGQDEAFVIGFTMGSTKAVSWAEEWWFKFAASNLYPVPYRMPRKILAAYELGLEAGRGMGVRNIHRAVDDSMLDRPLGDVRRTLGIDPAVLRRFYARERAILRGTAASERLPEIASGS